MLVIFVPMKIWVGLCTVLAFASFAIAQERHALVIGNNAYQNAPTLQNPKNDAAAVAERLENAGYQVTTANDADVRGMLRALSTFCDGARNAESALFFYAGHGIEVRGENYLLPIDAELAEEVDLSLEALSLKKVLEDMGKSGAKLKVVVLDCCRDNPFGTRSWLRTRSAGAGLAEVAQGKMAAGTMLVYAGAPGATVPDVGGGGHSPFTGALLTELESPGKSVAAVFSGVASRVTASEPWIRFDGSGKSFAAFSSYPLLPGSTTPTVPTPPKSDPRDPFVGTRAGETKRTALGSQLIWCPPGEFWMGSPTSEDGRDDDETRHRVQLSNGFWLGQHEVTQGEWETVMGKSLADQARAALQDDAIIHWSDGKKESFRDHWGYSKDKDPNELIGLESAQIPIYFVSWNDAVEFCHKLTLRERAAGRLPANWEYRLPTEAQWEYACRAGTSTALYNGKLTIKGKRNGPELDDIAWYGGNSSVGYEGRGWSTDDWEEKQYPGGRAGPRQVGQKQANSWGLHDMIGNVWEWCADCFDDYPDRFVSDPTGPSSGSYRVNRGGGWNRNASDCRSADRNWYSPTIRLSNLGFRVSVSSTQ